MAQTTLSSASALRRYDSEPVIPYCLGVCPSNRLCRFQPYATAPARAQSGRAPVRRVATARPASHEHSCSGVVRSCFMREAFNLSRERLWQENAAFAATISEGALVLDAGAGTAPYKSLFAHARYESADFEQVNKPYAHQTYTCDLSAIPVEDSRFDAVIFNQVMEHLPEPRAVLCELHRALRPGGRLIFSAPLFYEEHEKPYDFYRYTQFGVRYLFTQAGFESSGWIGSKVTSERWAINGAPLRGRCPGGATTTVVGSSGSSPRQEQ